MATQEVIVRDIPEDENIHIEIYLAGKLRNLDRAKSEPLEKTLARILSNLQKTGKKQKKSKNNSDSNQQSSQTSSNNSSQQQLNKEDIFIALYPNEDCVAGQEIDAQISNENAWIQDRYLLVGTQLYQIIYNPPTILKFYMIGATMVGYPIIPSLDLLFCEKSDCRWVWYRENQIINQTDFYTPTENDFNKQITIKVQVGKISSAEMTIGPIAKPPLRAHLNKIKPKQNNNKNQIIRVMNYNVLADAYLSTEQSQHLIQNCGKQYMDLGRRCSMVLDEIFRYQPDIICLQEVDEKAYNQFYVSQFEYAQYAGRYTRKQGQVREGCATFFRKELFSLICAKDLALFDCFKRPLRSLHKKYAPLLDSSKNLENALQKLGTVAQIILLERTPQSGQVLTQNNSEINQVCVINSHLFANYLAPHIRIIHAAAIVEEAKELVDQYNKDGTIKTGYLFCGDFNSGCSGVFPGVLQLLHDGKILKDHYDWGYGASYSWDDKDNNSDKNDNKSSKLNDTNVDADSKNMPTMDASSIQNSNSSSTNDICSDSRNDGVTGSTQSRQTKNFAQNLGSFQRGKDSAVSLSSVDSNCDNTSKFDTCTDTAIGSCSNLTTISSNDPKNSSNVKKSLNQSLEVLSQKQASDCSISDALLNENATIEQQEYPRENECISQMQAPEEKADNEIDITGIDIEIPFQFRSADDFSTSFTNYVSGYVGLLDYIFYTPQHFRVSQTVNQHTREDLGEGSIPNQAYPSDHVPIAFDLGIIPEVQVPDKAWHECPTPLNVFPATQEYVQTAIGRLLGHGVLALPSDTVYGFACNAESEKGIESIYNIKGRDEGAPIAVCVGDVSEISTFADTSQLPTDLLNKLLPGPITAIFPLLPTRRNLTKQLNPNFNSIGVRVFKEGFLGQVCQAFKKPLALTSANVSGYQSSLEINEFKSLWIWCGAVFNGGKLENDRIGSTVLDLTQKERYQILREGKNVEQTELILQSHGLQRNF